MEPRTGEQQLGGHCEIQRELTTDLHNTPIKLYYVRQSEPHYWVVKCHIMSLPPRHPNTEQNVGIFLTNVAFQGFSGCKLLQAHVHVKRRESCGRKFQSIPEMHIQHAGIKLSKTWTRRMCYAAHNKTLSSQKWESCSTSGGCLYSF